MSSEETITRRLSQGAIPFEETLQYALSLAQAIKASHERGRPLGNLHPDRVCLNGTSVTLLDGETGVQATPYLAPEQVRGETPDARSDIFAFGAILQEMLTGQKAFPGQGEEELKSSLLEAKPAPLDGVGPELSRLVSRCLAKDPGRRWQRAGALVIELKLAAAALRQKQQTADIQGHFAALRSQIGGLDEKLAAHQKAHVEVAGELRKRLDESVESAGQQAAKAAAAALAMAAVQQRVASLDRVVAEHSHAIESVESAIAQTDEVIEHVVDAFDSLRAEARAEANGVQA